MKYPAIAVAILSASMSGCVTNPTSGGAKEETCLPDEYSSRIYGAAYAVDRMTVDVRGKAQEIYAYGRVRTGVYMNEGVYHPKTFGTAGRILVCKEITSPVNECFQMNVIAATTLPPVPKSGEFNLTKGAFRLDEFPSPIYTGNTFAQGEYTISWVRYNDYKGAEMPCYGAAKRVNRMADGLNWMFSH